MGPVRGASKIFISYRRADSAAMCDRIFGKLTDHFGRDAIFKDIDNIPLGVDFAQYIEQAIAQCAVELVVIGKSWLDIAQNGVRRLDDPNDYVRLEIEAGLRRGIPVIPLLVDGATMPPVERLPESLRTLVRRNGGEVHYDPYFETDMRRVTTELGRVVPSLVRLPTTAGARAAVPAIPRQPATFGAIVRWSLAFGLPLAVIESVFAAGAAYVTYFYTGSTGSSPVLLPWLLVAMFAVGLAGFFQIGFVSARRTGGLGPGFLAASLMALIVGIVVGFVGALTDSVEAVARDTLFCSQGIDTTYCGANLNSRFTSEFPIFILYLSIVGFILSVPASAIGGALGRRLQPPSPEATARGRTILRVGYSIGGLVTLIAAVVIFAIHHISGADVPVVLQDLSAAAGIVLSAILVARRTQTIGSAMLVSLLTAVVAGIGIAFFITVVDYSDYGVLSNGSNAFIAGIATHAFGLVLVGVVVSLPAGAIGGSIGQALSKRVAVDQKATTNVRA